MISQLGRELGDARREQEMLAAQRAERLVAAVAKVLPLPPHASTALTSSDPSALSHGLVYLEQARQWHAPGFAMHVAVER